ncbi:Endonuclease [Desulfurella amilsii]|uniref:phospholipase D n=1 Tax=Desulfurella amilsii TaxID=1562698 RepID=A0A1X4XVR7_9BACT|nr:phospholipase D-like domain-containing protein [Desulfurella amilsii]OSS41632.1 Endonuclease [Desulfurella amilsii]
MSFLNIKKAVISLSLSLVLSQFVLMSNSFAYSVSYYSPVTNLQTVDLNWLQKALIPKTLYIEMYSFTDKVLAKKIIQLARQGAKVYIYRDDSQMRDKNDVTYMFRGVKNIHIKAKHDKGFWNIMHDKIFIIPNVVFREGSANWSPSAEGASCWHNRCGDSENQDNNATYITDKSAINQAIKVFLHMWNRKSNLIIQ